MLSLLTYLAQKWRGIISATAVEFIHLSKRVRTQVTIE